MKGFLLLIGKVLGATIKNLGGELGGYRFGCCFGCCKGGAWCHGWIFGCCLGRCCAGLTALSKQLPTKKVELRINLGAVNLAQKVKPLLVEHVRIVKCKV